MARVLTLEPVGDPDWQPVDTGGLTTSASDGQVPVAHSGGLAFFDAPVFNVKDPRFGAVGDGVTDDAAAFQDAHDAAFAAGGGIVLIPNGTYALSTPILLSPSNAGWIRVVGAGIGATTIKGISDNGSLTKFNKHTELEIYRYIEIRDLTMDVNSAAGKGHVLIGTRPWASDGNASYQTRLHMNNITVKRCRVINLPSDTTGTSNGVHLAGVVETAADSTELQITDIIIEDVRVDGGATGFVVFGTANSGSITGGNIKVFMDRIYLERCYHDTGVTPSGAGTQGFAQIGGVGYGRVLRIRDCHGFNESDVGIEVDGFTDAVLEGCTMTDCRNENFLIRNFRDPGYLAAQRVTLRNCVGINKNLDPVTSAGRSRISRSAATRPPATTSSASSS